MAARATATALPMTATANHTRARLDLAMAAIPTIHKAQRRRMLAWLDLMSRDAVARGQALELSATTPWDRSRLCWRVAAEHALMVPCVLEYLDTVGACEREAPALERLAQQIQQARQIQQAATPAAPAQAQAALLGAWLEAGEHGLEMGWWCPSTLPLEFALGFLPVGKAADADARVVRAWAREHGVEVTVSLTHSVHPDNPWTELWLPLPGAETLDKLRASRSAYHALAMPAPSDEAYAGLMRATSGAMVLVLGISANGPMRIGVAAVAPKLDGVIHLAQLSANSERPFQPAGLAGFLDALAVPEAPFAVTWLRDATGVGAELHYHRIGALSPSPDAHG